VAGVFFSRGEIMKTLKAIKGHSYGGKFHKVGDTYNAKDSDANLLVIVKNSVYHAETVAVVETKAMTAEKPKRAYNRKKTYETKVMTSD
jgi:hypothetical protein